jgi:hypothetical protein
MKAPGARKPDLPCGGVICSQCGTCIMRHYALTQGRCWNCNTPLRDDIDACVDGEGI